jgi:hypothetical protein
LPELVGCAASIRLALLLRRRSAHRVSCLAKTVERLLRAIVGSALRLAGLT